MKNKIEVQLRVYSLIKLFGIYEGIFLGFLTETYNKLHCPDGWFKIEGGIKYIEKEIKISCKKQKKICDKLERIGALQTKLSGVPPKKYYKITSLTIAKTENLNSPKRPNYTYTYINTYNNTNTNDKVSVKDNNKKSFYIRKLLHKKRRRILHKKSYKKRSYQNKSSSSIKAIFMNWNSLGDPYFIQHKKGTKREERIYNLIRKTLNKGNKPDTIMKAMETLHDFLSNKNKLFRGKIGLDTFLEFNRYESMNTYSNLAIDSLFEESKKGYYYLSKTYSKIKKDKNKALTQAIKDSWIKNVVNGNILEHSGRLRYEMVKYHKYRKPKQMVVFTSRDEDNFIKASELLLKFIDRNYNNLIEIPNIVSTKSPASYIDFIFRTIEEKGKKRIHTGFLIKDFLYDSNLYEYLLERGYIRK